MGSGVAIRSRSSLPLFGLAWVMRIDDENSTGKCGAPPERHREGDYRVRLRTEATGAIPRSGRTVPVWRGPVGQPFSTVRTASFHFDVSYPLS